MISVDLETVNTVNTVNTVDVDMTDFELDAKGLSCPMPLLKTKQAINGLPVDGVLRVEATDSGSWRDIQTWVKQAGHDLLLCQEDKDDAGQIVFIYRIKKL